jgi:hypothetical protein
MAVGAEESDGLLDPMSPLRARRRAYEAAQAVLSGPPRKFRISVMGLSYAANCSFRNSLWTSLGVR